MQRLTLPPRPNYQQKLENIGFLWHENYWQEKNYYQINETQYEQLRNTAQELTHIIFQACEYVMQTPELLSDIGIPEWLHQAVRESWKRDDPSLYMRLDFSYDGINAPKLLEINAQTPTSLLEAGVAQWQWLEDHKQLNHLPQRADQWNSIHETLVEQWRWILTTNGIKDISFTSAQNAEDTGTSLYIEELSIQAAEKNGTPLHTQRFWIEQLGVIRDTLSGEIKNKYLIDTQDNDITTLAMLWPFEFAWEGEDALALARTQTRFIEPLWKAVMSSKGFLSVLYKLFPSQEGVLPTYLQKEMGIYFKEDFVHKPLFSREGQNVRLPGQPSTPGDYGDLQMVLQKYAPLKEFQTPQGPRYPMFGIWIAGDEVCGLSIRESNTLVTDNNAGFVPHMIL